MIKLIYKTLAFSLVLAGMTSCAGDWLDRTPVDGVEDTEAIKSSSDLNTARIGMYQILKGSSTFPDYYGARMFYYGDVRGEDMQNEASGSRTKTCYDFTYSTANNAPNMWQVPYLVIGRANRVIAAAEAGGLSDQKTAQAIISQYAAEARVVRALAHFDLVRIYGKTYTADDGASLGVPVVTSVIDAEEKLPRNTVAEVYRQVITDLTDAINSGALSTDASSNVYINVWAAKALLARVYLTMGENENALAVAEDVIKNSSYTLWSNAEYAGAWQETSSAHGKEILFEFAITNSTDWTDREGIAYLYSEDGYADAIVTKKFLDLLNEDPDDVRHSILVAPVKADFIDKYKTNPVFMIKFGDTNSQDTDIRYNNIPLFRLSEVYLNAAEAAVKVGEQDKAYTYLDAIVNRANPTKHAASPVTLEAVLKERRKELVGEGHRFFDAMRNNETIVRYTSTADQGWQQALTEEARSFNRDFYKTLLPVPEYEMNANPEMKQNPGY